MKKILPFIMVLSILTSISMPLHAKNFSMVFWYPGEAGSTGEAEPVISAFFEYINNKLSGSKLSGKYFNTTAGGIGFIKNSKPDFGIASWIALAENKSALPEYSVLAKTLPFPHGTSKDQFAVIGPASATKGKWSPPDNLVIYSSIPMSTAFLKANLIPDTKSNTSIQPINNMLSTLKKIASENNPGQAALLTPMEKYTLDNLKGDWKTSLTTLYECPPISTAELIYFGNKPDVADQLIGVLKNMRSDPEGQAILEELRLKGFQ